MSKEYVVNRSFWLCLLLLTCRTPQAQRPFSTSLTEIKLTGPLADKAAQLSGLAWHKEWLILLPQYPSFTGQGSFIYGLPKQEIVAYLTQPNPDPLTPIPIPFELGSLNILGSQGFEAIAFSQDWPQTAVLAIEAAPWGQMRGYLLRGNMAADRSSFRLQATHFAEMLPQARQFNMAYESVLIADDQIYTFYELNGSRYNPSPQALLFDLDLTATGTAVLPHIPHRITDVTQVDENGRFWAINYLPRGLNLLTPQPIWWHHQPAIEQLIELQITDSQIIRTATPTLNLNGQAGRNWEGIVRLDDRGFLLATDNHPRSMLVFAPIAPQE